MAKTEGFSFRARASGRFPPDLSALLGLGFQHVSSSGQGVVVRKIEGVDLLGKPHLFTEVEIRRGAVSLRYSCPEGQSPQARRLQSCILLLRVLSLIPKLEVDAAGFGQALLPSLEFASSTAGDGFSALHRKFTVLGQEASSLRQRNSALTRSCEEEASSALERERRIAALEARVASLTSVSDPALSDLLLDWLSSHRGSFSAAAFSQQHKIPPSRAEQGLELLLKAGTIRQAGARFAAQKQTPHEVFEIAKGGIAGAASALSRLRLPAKD